MIYIGESVVCKPEADLVHSQVTFSQHLHNPDSSSELQTPSARDRESVQHDITNHTPCKLDCNRVPDHTRPACRKEGHKLTILELEHLCKDLAGVYQCSSTTGHPCSLGLVQIFNYFAKIELYIIMYAYVHVSDLLSSIVLRIGKVCHAFATDVACPNTNLKK